MGLTGARSILEPRRAAIPAHGTQNGNRIGAVRARRAYHLRHAGAVVRTAPDRIVPSAHQQGVERALGTVVADAAALEVGGG